MAGDAARFIGTIPDYYDRSLGPVLFADYAADIAQRAADGAPTRVIETAAGTGIVTRALRNLLPAEAHLTATDLYAPMLDVARAKFRPAEQVDFRAADAMALPFPDDSLDTAVCQFGTMFYPDKDKSYREMLRVLAPGGRYLFSVWDSHRHNPFGRITHETAGSFYSTDPPQFYQAPFTCHRIDPIKQALEDTGFTGINIAVIACEKEIPDLAAFARGLVYGNPLIDEIRSRGGVDPDLVVEALVAALAREFGDPGKMPLQAIFFSANKPR